MIGRDTFWDVYTEEFYSNHASEPHFSQTKLVGRAIAATLVPNSVVDLGCGVGAMLAGIAEDLSGSRLVGVEAPIAIERMVRAGAMRIPKEWYVAADLRELPTAGLMSVLLEDGRFDVAISAEVAEHLPAGSSAWHIDLLCALADTVVFSAAYPGQGGDQHVNERHWTYWREQFYGRRYEYDEETTRRLVGLFREDTTRAWGYAKNIRVYRKRGE